MSFPAITLPAEMTVAELAHRIVFEPGKVTAFPVAEGGRVVGLLPVAAIAEVPDEHRAATTVGELADRDPDLVIAEDQEVAELLERPAFTRLGRAAVLTRECGVGLLSITGASQVLRAFELAGGPSRPVAPRA